MVDKTTTADFPQEWRDKAIDYRQLKKLINQVAVELASLGLNPSLLHKLLDEQVICAVGTDMPATGEDSGASVVSCVGAIYEVAADSTNTPGIIAPRIRLQLSPNDSHLAIGSPTDATVSLDSPVPPNSIQSSVIIHSPWLQHNSPRRQLSKESVSSDESGGSLTSGIGGIPTTPTTPGQTLGLILPSAIPGSAENPEIIIPLTYDSAFFQLLTNALATLATLHQTTLEHSVREVSLLADMISSTSQPVSRNRKRKHLFGSSQESDLYAWRTIFQTWTEMQIFESISERDRGERGIAEVEVRLKRFGEELRRKGLSDDSHTFVMEDSREALRRFLKLNVLILDLKKFQYANAEATRKILKKHQKRTALPSTAASLIPMLNMQLSGRGVTLPHAVLATITQTLLPIIPSIDDYLCLICASIAFKPIRLACGHLFCVRCLAKMQKRGLAQYANCALCRSPTVFQADRTNLDEALMRFMKDWFPRETKIKARDNEREVAAELAEELGWASSGGTSGGSTGDSCCIM